MAYIVKKGDTLSGLYGKDWAKLSGYKGDPTKLQIGTELPDLPGSSSVYKPNAAEMSVGQSFPGGIVPPNTPKLTTPIVAPKVIQPSPMNPLTTAGQNYLKKLTDAGLPNDELTLKTKYRNRGFEDKYGTWRGSDEQYKAMEFADIDETKTNLANYQTAVDQAKNAGYTSKQEIQKDDQGNILPASPSTGGEVNSTYKYTPMSGEDYVKVMDNIVEQIGTTDLTKLIEDFAGGTLTDPEMELTKEDKDAKLEEIKTVAAQGLKTLQQGLAAKGMTFSGIRTEAEASLAADTLAKQTGVGRDFAGKIISAARQEQGRRETALKTAETNYNKALEAQGYVYNMFTDSIEPTLEGKKFALDVYKAGQEKPANAPASYDEWDFAGGKEGTGMSYANWLDRNETEKTQTVGGNLYTQDKNGQWRLTIKGKDSTSSTPLVKSGGLVIAESDIAKAQGVLDAHRGDDGFADTGIYLQLLKDWKDQKGLEQDFFKEFDPKNYLRYGDSTVPQYIKDNYLKKPGEEETDTEALTNAVKEMNKPWWLKIIGQ